MNDNLEFDNVVEALNYFVKNLDKAEVLVSSNSNNLNTYKNKIYEFRHKFFAINNPARVIFNLKNYKTYRWFLYSEILSEILNINPPIYSFYREDIFANSYKVQEDGRCSYLYGSRFQEWNGLLKIYLLLKNNPTSKGAVVPIFQNYDLGDNIIDKPCTTQYQFDLRDNKLNMFVSMRSWDMGPNGGFKYDFGLSSFILQSLAGWLKVEVGKLYFYVKSLHVYEKDIDMMKNLSLNNNNTGYEELLIDKSLDISDFYKDLRKIVEFENLLRNKIFIGEERIEKDIYYNFSKDFIKVFKAKNNACEDIKKWIKK